MNLAEAKTVGKQLGEALDTLLAASAGITEADFDVLQKRKEAFENSLVELRKNIDKEAASLGAGLAKKQAEVNAAIADLDVRLKSTEAAFSGRLETLRANETAAISALQNEKAAVSQAKNLELRSLNDEIAKARLLLNDINSQIDAGRRRFA